MIFDVREVGKEDAITEITLADDTSLDCFDNTRGEFDLNHEGEHFTLEVSDIDNIILGLEKLKELTA